MHTHLNSRFRIVLVGMVAVAAAFSASCYADAENSLAVVNAVLSSSEDGPAVSSDYRFLPGDTIYFSFEIAGFAVHTENNGEIKKISLSYEITAQDDAGKPLADPANGGIQTDLSPEDKNWVPKRRASFLLPSYVAAGSFHIHAAVKDLFARTETTRDFPFLLGGVQLTPASSVTIENFRFLRSENDTEPLNVPAYSPGDTVYARFEMTGFQIGPDNHPHVAYGVTVLDPNGKAFLRDPEAAGLDSGGTYPAQFIPGNIALKMDKNNAHGQYSVVVKAHDLLAKQTYELKQSFSIE